MATAPKTHRPLNSGTPRQEYDKRRGSAVERGYDAAWHKVRTIKVKRNPLCEDCEANGLTVPIVIDGGYDNGVVDHVIPINGKHDRLRLDMDNLRSRCKACHTAKTRMDVRIRGMFDELIHAGVEYEKARDDIVSRVK